MTISDEIREAVRAARTASETAPDDPFRGVLDEVARGITGEGVEARFVSRPGGRWSLMVAPEHQPGRAVAMVDVVLSAGSAEVRVDPSRRAATPDELVAIMKKIVTDPPFLQSLQEIGELSVQPVEGFLRVRVRNVSREDLMLEVAPEVQRRIAERVGQDVTLRLKIADFPGAGRFTEGARYEVLESAGFAVRLDGAVVQEEDGWLRVAGRVLPREAS